MFRRTNVTKEVGTMNEGTEEYEYKLQSVVDECFESPHQNIDMVHTSGESHDVISTESVVTLSLVSVIP